MSEIIKDKMPADFVLTREAKYSYITGFEVIKGKTTGQISQIKVSLADGTVDFYPNYNKAEESQNIRRLHAIEKKQVLDAIKNKKIFEDKAKISKGGFVISRAWTLGMFIAFLLSTGIASLESAFSNLLISSNAVAYLSIAAIISAAVTTFMYNKNKKHQHTLDEIKKYEDFLNNEELIHEYQTKPVVLLGLKPAMKNNLAKVLKAEPLSIYNLHALSYIALSKLIENIREHEASEDPYYECARDTIGASEYSSGMPKKPKKLFKIKKPKRTR
ncbi:MAG TPA: hypothetical protein PLX66_01685 [Bacilli bacterium]|nr:hypothetical protein [Bacilli bacterium]